MIDLSVETRKLMLSNELSPEEYDYFDNTFSDCSDNYLLLCYAIKQFQEGEFNGWALDEDFELEVSTSLSNHFDIYSEDYAFFNVQVSYVEHLGVLWFLENQVKDSINPDYYNWHPVECKEVTNHFNFNLGCAIKYIWRSGGPVTKGSEIEDLKKAIRYLEFEIERLKNV